MGNVARGAKHPESFYSAEHVSRALADIEDVQYFDLPDARLACLPGFFDQAESRELMRSLIDELIWQQPVLKMFGRDVLSPRLHAWHGDENADYRWSGRTWHPEPWVSQLAVVRDKLQRVLNIRFNSCLVNRYRNGDDAMGWHADDEPELGANPVIASVSLGALRDFDLRHRDAGSETSSIEPFRIPLGEGSLFVMFGATQHHWKHRIRRQRRVTGERLNLTFRVIEPGSAR